MSPPVSADGTGYCTRVPAACGAVEKLVRVFFFAHFLLPTAKNVPESEMWKNLVI